MSRIAGAFADGPAFIPYLAAGDPEYQASLEYVRAVVRGGADILELGLPFSEPIAEGPTIQQAIVRSLASGMTPNRYFEFVEELAVDVPVVCMTYYNLIYQYGDAPGPGPFVERAASAGIDGFVVPDLPVEESGPLKAACEAEALDLIFIVAPTTTAARLERIREAVSGYVYVQARLGTTGARGEVSDQTGASLARLADWEVPKAVGFGISTGEHAREIVAAGADGIIVGSALVDIVADGTAADASVASIVEELETKASELKHGATSAVEAEPEHK